MPFSDPLADGPVIQRATERALAAGGNLRVTLDIIRKVRSDVKAPIVVFSYANPLLRLGIAEFASRAAGAGVDGVLALDLPIEEAGAFQETMAASGLDTIFLLSPTTTDAADQEGRSARPRLPVWHLAPGRDRRARPGVVRAPKRWCAGFARSRRCRLRSGSAFRVPSMSRKSAALPTRRWSGSALVSLIAEESGSPQLVDRVEAYVRSLRARAGRRDAGEIQCDQKNAEP